VSSDEHDNEPSGFIKAGIVADQLNNYQLPSTDSDPYGLYSVLKHFLPHVALVTKDKL
jgi:hypothetical protein